MKSVLSAKEATSLSSNSGPFSELNPFVIETKAALLAFKASLYANDIVSCPVTHSVSYL